MAYQLTVSEKQTRVLIEALDFYSRIKCGQLSEVAYILSLAVVSGERPAPRHGALDQARAMLDRIQEILFPELGSRSASYGIREAPGESEKIAYDIQQVIRHRIAWDTAEEGKCPEGVWGYEPWKTSKTEKLAQIAKL